MIILRLSLTNGRYGQWKVDQSTAEDMY